MLRVDACATGVLFLFQGAFFPVVFFVLFGAVGSRPAVLLALVRRVGAEGEKPGGGASRVSNAGWAAASGGAMQRANAHSR